MACLNFRVSTRALLIYAFQLCIAVLHAQPATGAKHHRDQPMNDVQSGIPSTPPPAPPTCPCVRPPSGGPCISYDSRYQAATLDEVVMNFIDTTASDPNQALNIFGQKPFWDPSSALKPNTALQCKSLECVACFHALSERLAQQLGPVEAAGLGLTSSPNLAPQLVGTNTPPLHCRRLQQQQTTRPVTPRSQRSTARPPQVHNPGNNGPSPSRPNPGQPQGSGNGQPNSNGQNGPGSGRPNFGTNGNNPGQPQPGQNGNQPGLPPNIDDNAWLILGEFFKSTSPPPETSSTLNSSWSSTFSTPTTYSNTSSSWRPFSSTVTPRRNKRDAPPGPGSGKLGNQSPLDCSYKKGDLIDDNSGYVGLCNLCWSIRTLSDKYFPRYVNELSCDSSDNGCLSGYAKCRERYRSIDILFNTGTDAVPKWMQYSINSPVACECEVLSGSALHNFISH